MSKPSRGRLYIDKDVQRALVLQLMRHWLIFVTVLAGMLLALETLRDPHASLTQHARQLWYSHAPLLIVIASLFPVFLYDSIKLSNRFAGPILRLRRALREAVSGESTRPLQFRKDDFWQDMADSFNALLPRLKPLADAPPAERAAWADQASSRQHDEQQPALSR
jgi:hypothetical protein